jgi:hypothetical protein
LGANKTHLYWFDYERALHRASYDEAGNLTGDQRVAEKLCVSACAVRDEDIVYVVQGTSQLRRAKLGAIGMGVPDEKPLDEAFLSAALTCNDAVLYWKDFDKDPLHRGIISPTDNLLHGKGDVTAFLEPLYLGSSGEYLLWVE